MPCRPAISSHSLGRAWVQSMKSKLDAAARYGLDIEMFYEDLEYFAQSFHGETTVDKLLEAAKAIRSMCDERGISIVCLQPFMHYEGLRDRQLHLQRVEEMKVWIRIAKLLQTSIIAIPSTCLSEREASGDLNLIVRDMQEVAGLAAPAGIKIAYESLAWGTYSNTWEQAWHVVEKVDRPNFGICLDTFNMAGRVYADPTASSRRTPNAEDDMRRSLKNLVQTIDPQKIFYIQVVDAEYLAEPLVAGHPYYNPHQHPRMSWSRNCRLFYGEKHLGAYLPIKAILTAILKDLAFEGWVSAELFNISLTDSDPLVPEQHAQRAARSWQNIVADFNVTVQPKSQALALTSRTQSGHNARAQL